MIPTYDVIWRHMTVYGRISNNATINFSYLGIFSDVWICQHSQHMHVMLNSKVIKTQFRLDSVYTCHIMLCTCHSLVYPVIHQLYIQSFFSYLWGSFWCLNLHGCTSHTHIILYWSQNLINRGSEFRQWASTGQEFLSTPILQQLVRKCEYTTTPL